MFRAHAEHSFPSSLDQHSDDTQSFLHLQKCCTTNIRLLRSHHAWLLTTHMLKCPTLRFSDFIQPAKWRKHFLTCLYAKAYCRPGNTGNISPLCLGRYGFFSCHTFYLHTSPPNNKTQAPRETPFLLAASCIYFH